MTPKQIERIYTKIKKIRAALAAEKRKFGCYDDSRGMRYIPLQLFVKIEDYKGGLVYLRWFKKNFPDDIGFPDFLFEWTLILFKNGKLKDAEQKAIETYFSNSYLFDKFFGREIIPIEKYEYSNVSTTEFMQYFTYSSEQVEFADFSAWLMEYENSERFQMKKEKFIEINK
ncbi:hypothetical protein [uncultured Draconibacterium sp.]|uniref:hypothetical protein n=1 Tax=uncultured Draconibacterium sp. TaxID=1573823 RepID=UPI003260A240